METDSPQRLQYVQDMNNESLNSKQHTGIHCGNEEGFMAYLIFQMIAFLVEEAFFGLC